MMRGTHMVVVALAALAALGAGSPEAQEAEAGPGFVVICPISGMVDDGLRVLVERAVVDARGAQALVLEVDTPGGMLDAAIDISKAIGDAPCPTIAYIKDMGAISAGALISFACQDIIMAPDSNIGAATPVIASAEGMQPTGEKEVSFMRAKMRALAERNGHNPAIAEAMVDKDVELRSYVDAEGNRQVFGVYPKWGGEGSPIIASKSIPVETIRELAESLPAEMDNIREAIDKLLPSPVGPSEESAPTPPQPDGAAELGEVILPAGKLLTLTPQEAIKYGLIPTTANNLDEVLGYYGHHGAEIRRMELTLAERIFRFLTNPLVSSLLLVFGIGGLYLEIKTPGFGLPGTVGLICLALFFGAHLVLGVANWLDVLLIVTGVILVLVEVFLIPGFGVVGTVGILCLILGFYLSLTRVPWPQYSWDYARLKDAGLTLTLTGALLTAFVYATWTVFWKTPLHRRIVLVHEQLPGSGYTVQTIQDRDEMLGMRGVAESMLRPAGRGRFEGKSFQVVSRAEYLPPGTPIRVVQVDGNRIVVDPETPENTTGENA